MNQLPSVGPGSVLKDIDSTPHVFPVVILTKIFRQAGESDIIVNAHKINRGEQVVLDNKSRDFFFLKRQDPNVIISNTYYTDPEEAAAICRIASEPYDIQVLTPMRKGRCSGVERLNTDPAGNTLNPPKHRTNRRRTYGDQSVPGGGQGHADQE